MSACVVNVSMKNSLTGIPAARKSLRAARQSAVLAAVLNDPNDLDPAR